MQLKRHILTVTMMTLALGLLFTPLTGYAKNMAPDHGIMGEQAGMSIIINKLPPEELSIEEETGLTQMREEEKLARDVYFMLYKQWQLPIFSHISRSEQRHMNIVKSLLEKYELTDPVADSTVGVFTAAEFQGLYETLVAQGSESLIDALIVGATIEDLDIKDLQTLIDQTDNLDMLIAYQNLLKGSRNHLRAFLYQLSLYGVTYEAQYLTDEEIEAIITAPREKGRVDENGDPVSGINGPVKKEVKKGAKTANRKGAGEGTGECNQN